MATAPAPTSPTWQQGELIELTIHDLSDRGDGVGRFEQRVVFVPDTVTGDRVRVRLLHVKPQFAHGKLIEILEPSPHRVRPSCIVADKCGGCQWQHVNYDYQREAKRNLVVQALDRVGGFDASFLEQAVEQLLPMHDALHYRNKSTYPIGIAENHGPMANPKQPRLHGKVIAGYYQKGSHQIVNLNQCPIQDDRLDEILAGVKQDIQTAKWPIYNESNHQGTIRHLSLRIGRRTGEKLLTIVAKDDELKQLWQYSQAWMEEYDLVGVCLNINSAKTNAVFGDISRCISGREYLQEEFAGLQFQIRPETFFQVHTEQAEAIVHLIEQELQLTGSETLLDAYCGIGTLTLPLAKKVKKIVGIELQSSAVDQLKINAKLNQIDNLEWHVGSVEALLPGLDVQPDVVLLDPPRKGCDGVVIASLIQRQPARIVYMSCNPATLARDLKMLCGEGGYRLGKIQPADFFPQTAHVETVVFLHRGE
jgi:23S rRNA (uracil1939-C5)-methyltransferase